MTDIDPDLSTSEVDVALGESPVEQSAITARLNDAGYRMVT
jgi:hypothetical protein